MPGVGGPARKIAPWPRGLPYPGPAGWSPDSTQVAFALGQGVNPWLEVLTLPDRVSRKLSLPQRPLNNVVLYISWSPDGRWIAYGRSLSAIAATSELWLTRTSDGESFQLTGGSSRDSSPSWSRDSRRLYFVSDRGGTPDLWRLAINDDGGFEGPSQQVTAGIEMVHAVLSAVSYTHLTLPTNREV